MKVLIAGGGIGGLATAVALAQRGIAVELLEKSPEFIEIGAGIQLAPNASRALDRLGVLDRVAEFAVFPRRIVWLDAIRGEQLTYLDLGDRFVERFGYRYLVMHRSDLLMTLLQAAQASPLIALATNKTVSRVDDDGDGVRVHTTDGSVHAGDILVGADGLWSTIRPLIVDDGPPICAEYVAYRGTIPMEAVTAHAGLDNVVLWSGPSLHLVQYPLRRGELFNQVAVFKSNRYRPDSDDWGGTDELDEHFGHAAAPVRSALTNIKRNRRWPLFDRLPISRWTRGRIALLGDAAHPMLQYVAQGAGQALEDAVAFADALAAFDDVSEAFAAYEAARCERTGRVQTTARAFGEYKHLHPGPEADARNAFLAARAPDDFAPMDWLYAYGISAPSPSR